MQSSRRHFLMGSALAGAASFTAAQSRPPVISKVTLLQVPGDFVRPVAMNAYDTKATGKAGHIKLIRAFLSDGTMGLGVEGYVAIREPGLAFLKQMIGVDPQTVFRWSGERIVGLSPKYAAAIRQPENSWFENVLLDLVGKMRGKPVYQLFGEAVRDRLDCYDGSLYFVDIASNRGAEAVGEVAKAIQRDGYRALKIKVGRPSKWLPGEAGVVRDTEAFIAAREAVGWNFNIMADANNGYAGRFDWAVRFLKACSPYEMYWIEEIFPETVEDYRKLFRALLEVNAVIPVAEGENIHMMEEFQPYLEADIYRYIQPDMRTCGFSKILQAADLAAPHRVKVVPHNWMSQMGKHMSMHAAKICKNIPFVEDDRFHNFALDASSYQFQDGQWSVSEKPGWGIDLSGNYELLQKAATETVIT
jgi:D-galactarolactone cycloisomerase